MPTASVLTETRPLAAEIFDALMVAARADTWRVRQHRARELRREIASGRKWLDIEYQLARNRLGIADVAASRTQHSTWHGKQR